MTRLRDLDGLPVGTGRLLPNGVIGRMAVRKAMRGQGIGFTILEAFKCFFLAADVISVQSDQQVEPLFGVVFAWFQSVTKQ